MNDGQPSQTARRVAAQRRHFQRVPTGYGDPAADQLLHDDVAGDIPYDASRFTAYLARRTEFFDRAVVEAISRRCQQIVVLGAGYDGRSLRYSTVGVRWFELDHPATMAAASARRHRLGISDPTVTHVAVDFAVDDVGAALGAAGHDTSRASLFYCEGVTPYLDRGVVTAVLTSLHGRAGPAGQLAIDFALRPATRPARRSREALRARVKAQGEPLRFELAKNELPAVLSEAGWWIVRAVDPAGADISKSERPSVFVTAVPAADKERHGA